MTHPNNPFRWVIPLQHMSKVKIVEILWRNSVGRHKVKDVDRILYFDYSIQNSMIQHLEKDVDRLPLPEVMKNELMVFVIGMCSGALECLQGILMELTVIDQLDETFGEIIAHLVDNFSWDSSGCVDGRTMLESYIRGKNTIDFNTWRMLCAYCIEDDIMRLSKTIDWKNCKVFTDSPHCIYWYWKIYREFPREEMFTSKEEYCRFEIGRAWEGLYDEANMIQNILRRSAHYTPFAGGISAIKYFRSQLGDEEKFQKMLSNGENIFSFFTASTFYLLGQLKKQSWREPIHTAKESFQFLMEFPFIQLRDHWTGMLEGGSVLRCHFMGVFASMDYHMLRWKIEALGQKNQVVVYNKMLYGPFKELWALFNQRFELDDESAREAFHYVYAVRDVTLCKIMFEGVERSGKRYSLKILGSLAGSHVGYGPLDADFCTQLLEKVLNADEEREILRKIVHANLNRRSKSSDYELLAEAD